MRRSAIPPVLLGVALLLVAGCGGAADPVVRQADDAYRLYDANPDPNTYETFVRANRLAAGRHGSPHDRTGVEFQLRALEVMSKEAERTKDLRLADDVVERVAEIEGRDLVGNYEETLPGARVRLEDAKRRAGAVIR